MQDDPDLDAAYSLETPEDNLRLYSRWAETYDNDFARQSDYVLHLRVAEAFVAAGGRGPVLDLGAGTGLCAEALAALKVRQIDGTDLSRDMLGIAAAKNVYRSVFAGNLLERLPVADAAYAGAVSSGTFTHGHVGPEALDEVLRILRPGGLCVLSINAEHWDTKGFAAKFNELGAHITGFASQDVQIYGPAAQGPHAADLGKVVSFRRS